MYHSYQLPTSKKEHWEKKDGWVDKKKDGKD